MRLDKFLADANLGTRKHVKTLIRSRHVNINNSCVTLSDYNLNPELDKVEVDGKLIKYRKEIFILLNKPKGYICSNIDELYPSVLNLIDQQYAKRVKIVGRLDVDTTGVLLLTDQGKINNSLVHPRLKIEKEYEAVLNHPLPKNIIPQLTEEIDIGKDEKVKPRKVYLINDNTCRIIIAEGKYHEVKRIFRHFDLEVMELRRIRLAFLNVDDLQIGESRLLSDVEIEKIKAITGND
ncbi:MAG: pseudouridine synthase [Bacilli bacterium]|nr:pseudouridine synthase [Bacilli bacterium]